MSLQGGPQNPVTRDAAGDYWAMLPHRFAMRGAPAYHFGPMTAPVAETLAGMAQHGTARTELQQRGREYFVTLHPGVRLMGTPAIGPFDSSRDAARVLGKLLPGDLPKLPGAIITPVAAARHARGVTQRRALQSRASADDVTTPMSRQELDRELVAKRVPLKGRDARMREAVARAAASPVTADVLPALERLGYNRADAGRMIEDATAVLGPDASTERVLQWVLKQRGAQMKQGATMATANPFFTFKPREVREYSVERAGKLSSWLVRPDGSVGMWAEKEPNMMTDSWPYHDIQLSSMRSESPTGLNRDEYMQIQGSDALRIYSPPTAAQMQTVRSIFGTHGPMYFSLRGKASGKGRLRTLAGNGLEQLEEALAEQGWLAPKGPALPAPVAVAPQRRPADPAAWLGFAPKAVAMVPRYEGGAQQARLFNPLRWEKSLTGGGGSSAGPYSVALWGDHPGGDRRYRLSMWDGSRVHDLGTFRTLTEAKHAAGRHTMSRKSNPSKLPDTMWRKDKHYGSGNSRLFKLTPHRVTYKQYWNEGAARKEPLKSLPSDSFFRMVGGDRGSNTLYAIYVPAEDAKGRGVWRDKQGNALSYDDNPATPGRSAPNQLPAPAPGANNQATVNSVPYWELPSTGQQASQGAIVMGNPAFGEFVVIKTGDNIYSVRPDQHGGRDRGPKYETIVYYEGRKVRMDPFDTRDEAIGYALHRAEEYSVASKQEIAAAVKRLGGKWHNKRFTTANPVWDTGLTHNRRNSSPYQWFDYFPSSPIQQQQDSSPAYFPGTTYKTAGAESSQTPMAEAAAAIPGPSYTWPGKGGGAGGPAAVQSNPAGRHERCPGCRSFFTVDRTVTIARCPKCGAESEVVKRARSRNPSPSQVEDRLRAMLERLEARYAAAAVGSAEEQRIRGQMEATEDALAELGERLDTGYYLGKRAR